MINQQVNFMKAAPLTEVEAAGCKVVQLGGHTIVLVAHGGEIYAVDNRCPHMGFPLNKGSVHDGILTCHWHHARFSLETGGTFDQFADDVRAFPVEVRDGHVWIDIAAKADAREHQRDRLQVGLERNISLVIGKAVLVLLDNDGDAVEPFRLGLDYGARYRRNGWGQGLTMLTCSMNMLPHLDVADRPRALYHGLAAVASESFGSAPRFPIRPLPHSDQTDLATLKGWFRQFIAVRDDEGAERCIVSAIRSGATSQQMADMLFCAVTDFRFIDVGHSADFTNKAFEALDIAGWDYAERVLTSLVGGYARASRMEEANSWRHPIDLVAISETAFEQLPAALHEGEQARSGSQRLDEAELQGVLLDDNPQAITDALLAALRSGYSMVELAQAVSHAAIMRIVRFHTSNEFSDWDAALHTFSFANAIEQGLRRAPSVELLRGVFDGAMRVYLNRFLNIPAARLPGSNGHVVDGEAVLTELAQLLDRQQQVDNSATAVAHYLDAGASPQRLLAAIGRLLLREDRNFHTIQTVEAAVRQYELRADSAAGRHALIAAIRYLAAHAPTVRAQEQTYTIAVRLHRDELLYEDSD